jgi:hypothetical protein
MKEGTLEFRQGDTTGAVAPAAAAAAATPTGTERRRTPRHPVDRDVMLRLADAGNLGPVPARMVDLSAGGVGVRLQRPLAPGKQFTLEVGSTPPGSAGNGVGTEAFALRYQVVRCKPLGHGMFHVGAEFVRMPAPAAPKPNGGVKRP